MEFDWREDADFECEEGLVLYDFRVKAGKILCTSKTTIATSNAPIDIPAEIKI